ncbi:glycosyltransferase [Turicibacter sanguinis]|nr:glycosyltransferase [Turicibacter sanguinis]
MKIYLGVKSSLNDYYYSKKIKKKSLILYNVIDSNDLYNKIKLDNNEYENDIVFLGRMSYPKNPLRLIKIISEVIKVNPKTKVALIGSGEYDNEVKNLIVLQGLTQNIKLYGFVQNPYKILNQSKIMIMTSRYEGTPMCALEAIACGLPIITTITDGLSEIIIDGETGFLSNEDNILIDKINYLLENESELKEMRKKVKKHNETINNIEKYKCIINEVYSE